MRRATTILFLLVAAGAAGCGDESSTDVAESNLESTKVFDFSEGDDHGFIAIFRDVPVEILAEYERRKESGEPLGPVAPVSPPYDDPAETTHWMLNSGIHDMPDGIPGKGFLTQGNNHSDDLDMWIARKLDARDGLEPNTRYRATFAVTLAGDAVAMAYGIGGGQDMSLDAALTLSDPTRTRIVSDHVRFLEHPRRDEMAGVGGNAVCVRRNGTMPIPPSVKVCPVGQGRIPFELIHSRPSRPIEVRTDDRGELWLMVGGHSGYEDFTGIYYQSVRGTLTRLD